MAFRAPPLVTSKKPHYINIIAKYVPELPCVAFPSVELPFSVE